MAAQLDCIELEKQLTLSVLLTNAPLLPRINWSSCFHKLVWCEIICLFQKCTSNVNIVFLDVNDLHILVQGQVLPKSFWSYVM